MAYQQQPAQGHGHQAGGIGLGGALAAGALGAVAGAAIGAGAMAMMSDRGDSTHAAYASYETHTSKIIQQTVASPESQGIADAYGGMKAGAGRDNPPDEPDDGEHFGGVGTGGAERRMVMAASHWSEPRTWWRGCWRQPQLDPATRRRTRPRMRWQKERCDGFGLAAKTRSPQKKDPRSLVKTMRESLDFIEFGAQVSSPALLQCHRGDPRAITIVTQCSVDRLPRLAAMAAAWEGEISCAVLIPSDADSAAEARVAIEKMHAATVAGGASLSLVLYQEFELTEERASGRTSWAAGLYPINALRNAALLAAATEYVFLLDVDFVPSPGAHKSLQELAMSRGRSREALVVPAFEVRGKAPTLPVSLEEVREQVRAGRAEGFHVTRYPKGHLPTDFERWLCARKGDEYSVEYNLGFEPYIVARREEVPRYDARFRGYGLNKVVHLYRLAVVEGFSFVVVPEHFVSAPEHEQSTDYRRTYGTGRDPLQAARVQALWDLALEEMALEVASKRELAGAIAKSRDAIVDSLVLQTAATIVLFHWQAAAAALLFAAASASHVNDVALPLQSLD